MHDFVILRVELMPWQNNAGHYALWGSIVRNQSLSEKGRVAPSDPDCHFRIRSITTKKKTTRISYKNQ